MVQSKMLAWKPRPQLGPKMWRGLQGSFLLLKVLPVGTGACTLRHPPQVSGTPIPASLLIGSGSVKVGPSQDSLWEQGVNSVMH